MKCFLLSFRAWGCNWPHARKVIQKNALVYIDGFRGQYASSHRGITIFLRRNEEDSHPSVKLEVCVVIGIILFILLKS